MQPGREQPLPEDFWAGSSMPESPPTWQAGRTLINDMPAGTGMGPDADIWPIYNKKAEKFDKEIVETYNGGMDNLLIFAALFSAVVTAVLILSLPLLEPDSAQATVDALAIISGQLATLSFTEASMVPMYQMEAFSIPPSAVIINGLWMLSLMMSLSASMLAMLVKQWIRAYDTVLLSSPKDRALHRQFRFVGLRTWHVAGIANSLPIVIHMAVALFFVGLIVYLWNIAVQLGLVLCVLH